MAGINGSIKVESECRPCFVNDKKALFHRWVERSEIIPPSNMIGGHCGADMKGGALK